MEEIWNVEKRLWLEGIAVFKQSLAEEYLMAFQDPVGILEGQAVLEGLKNAPRWDKIEFHSQHEINPSPHVAVIAYKAVAERSGSEYCAYCTSTYLKNKKTWLLIQHQQTPISKSL